MGFLSLSAGSVASTKSPASIFGTFTPRSISGLALWLDASSSDLYTTDAGPVVAVASPLEIAGCALWLDGADSSAASMTLDGTLVETWKDKSGNGRDFTATSTARPTLTASAINSRSAVTFNGSANTMTGNAAAEGVIRNLAGYTVFSVLKTASVAAGERLAFGVGATVLFRLGQQDSRPFIGGRRVNADSLESVTDGSGTLTVSTTFIQTAVVNHSSQSLTGIRNGAAFATDATYMAAGSSENLANAVSVGTQAGGTYGFWNGEIAELIVYPTALTTAQRASVEAYLAAKWSISGVHVPATASSDPVGYWGDRSGNGRHAVRSIGSRRPSVSATAQNGKKTIAFTSASLTGMTAPGGQSMKDGATFCGAYFSGNVNYSMLLNVGENANGTRWDIGSNATRANLSYYPSTLTPQASMSNVTCILTGVFNKAANTVTLRMNGAEIATGTASPALASYASDVIGIGMSNLDNEQHLNGRVFELAAYNQPLLPAQARRLEQYLATRWGITLAPTVANADAQDWINRVYSNGGTVSSATASAVNQFCDAIDAASLRSKMLRLNLFCGTGLNACLTPLYRAASLGDTQLGNATDTNVGGLFVSGNYSESGGLVGDGSTKYLKTGLASNQLAGGLTGHAAIWRGAGTVATTRIAIGGSDSDVDDFEIQERTTSTHGAWGKTTFAGSAPANVAGLKMINRSSSTRADLYSNGSSIANSTASVVVAPHANEFYVFGGNRNGTLTLPVALPVFAYSIGVSMDATQATDYYNALSAFQTSLSRT